jgi:AcrR family transcriptional regulator
VEKIYEAAASLLNEVGHEDMTVRMVAARAGVSPATAYSYFASKDHLFAEMFWRLLASSPGAGFVASSPAARVRETAEDLARQIADAPALAAAVTKGLLGSDPEVQRLRLAIGGLWIEQFREAAGDGVNPDVVATLGFAFTGVLLQAGMRIISYEQLPGVVGRVMDVITHGWLPAAGRR